MEIDIDRSPDGSRYLLVKLAEKSYNEKASNILNGPNAATFRALKNVSDAYPTVAKIDLQNGAITEELLGTDLSETKNPFLIGKTMVEIEKDKFIVRVDFIGTGKFRLMEINIQ